jgi:hypothetical protein
VQMITFQYHNGHHRSTSVIWREHFPRVRSTIEIALHVRYMARKWWRITSTIISLLSSEPNPLPRWLAHRIQSGRAITNLRDEWCWILIKLWVIIKPVTTFIMFLDHCPICNDLATTIYFKVWSWYPVYFQIQA